MTTLNDNKMLKFKKPAEMVKDFQGCGINSLLTFLYQVSPDHKITIDELKKIFDYDADGISSERYKFNRFNTLLSEHNIPYKAFMKDFASKEDLLKYLSIPVPVYFEMRVIKQIRDKFKYSQVNLNFGDENDLFNNMNLHLLLLVGYEEQGETLYFIDPVYQLPYYTDKDLSDKDKLCALSSKQFYEYTKRIKLFIELRQNAKLAKQYKQKTKNEAQKKLKC